jgi:hypothetical protein
MPIRVFCCSSYPAFKAPWTPDQMRAAALVRALKACREANDSGASDPADAAVQADAVAWFATTATTKLTWRPVRPLTLVPVPDSHCALDASLPPRTVALAAALASALPHGTAAVADVLRWAQPMDSAHSGGGTRDPQELYSALRLTRRGFGQDRPQCVIVDDVLASGAHIRAVAAFLRDCGASILAAICAAQATEVAVPDPFAVRTTVLPNFVSDPDWLLFR